MRDTLVICAKWVLPPGLILLLLFALTSDQPAGGYGRELAASYKLGDPKLRRTLKAWRDAPSPAGIRPRRADGLMTIELEVSPPEFERLGRLAEKLSFKEHRHDCLYRIDGAPVAGTYKLHGATSLRPAYEDGPQRLRFSYTPALFSPLVVGDGVVLRKFFLVSLTADAHAFRNHFAYSLLRELGLFPAHTEFVRFRLNGRDMGFYLLAQRPEDALRRAHDPVLGIYRRWRHSGYDRSYRLYQGEELSPGEALRRLDHTLEKRRGDALVKALDAQVDLAGYLRLLAVHALLRNPDYHDELYLCLVPSPELPYGRILFSAWDFDDIMAAAPAHPKRVYDDPLLFAAEDRLDRLIVETPALYARYRETLRRLLNEQLTDAHLAALLTATEAALPAPDAPGLTSAESAFLAERRRQIAAFQEKLLARRAELLQHLADGDAAPAPAVR